MRKNPDGKARKRFRTGPSLKWPYSYTKPEKNQAFVSIYYFLFRSITFLDPRACPTTRPGSSPNRINSKLISPTPRVEIPLYYYKRRVQARRTEKLAASTELFSTGKNGARNGIEPLAPPITRNLLNLPVAQITRT